MTTLAPKSLVTDLQAVCDSVSSMGSLPCVKALVVFNGVEGVSITESFNVSSVTRSARGHYVVAFSVALPDANYAVLGTSQSEGGTSLRAVHVAGGTTPTVNGFEFEAINPESLAYDSPRVMLVVLR